LLEQALIDIGIQPNVIDTPDSVEGAIPLIHSQHCIVKLHGDYLDSRIKNTENELASYDPRINLLLDRIFDEFGLVVCGWSAEYDIALRQSIERCRNRRYATYWLQVGGLSDAANRLVQHRDAQVIQSDGADRFFRSLADKIDALVEVDQSHPLSIKTAVYELKKYVADEKCRIKLHDLVVGETERLIGIITDLESSDNADRPNKENIPIRFARYEAATEVLRVLIANGCYWGEPNNRYLWTKCIQRLVGLDKYQGGFSGWLELRKYPALLVLYAGGVASIASGRLENLAALTIDATYKDGYIVEPLVIMYNARRVGQGMVELLPGLEKRKTPMSDHLFEVISGSFTDLIPDNEHYQECFDRFEYYVALLHADYEASQGNSQPWAPTGCFLWRHYHSSYSFENTDLVRNLRHEVDKKGSECSLLQAGMFDGSVDRLRSAIDAVSELVSKIPQF
jgi:hypothetical protein